MDDADGVESPDRRRAIRRMRLGGWAGVALALGWCIPPVIPALNAPDASELAAVMADPGNLVAAAVVLALAIGLLRGSRLAAVSLLLLQFATVVVFIQDGFFAEGAAGLALTLIYGGALWVFLRAAIGAFAVHRWPGPAFVRAPRWRRGLAIVVLAPWFALSIFIAIFGALFGMGLIPDDTVVTGERLPDSLHRELVAIDVVREDETLLFVRSTGLWSIREDGAVLTTEAVRIYSEQSDGDVLIGDLPLDQVGAVLPIAPGGIFEDSVWLVRDRAGEDRFHLYLSTYARGDQRFIDTLRDLAPPAWPGPPVSDGWGVT